MKTSIDGAVFALLLARAAPVPFVETLTGHEQESVCVVSRPSRNAIRQASPLEPRGKPRVDVVPLSTPTPLRGSVPHVLPSNWIPPILSRPPPL
jgi:hypothetical protein